MREERGNHFMEAVQRSEREGKEQGERGGKGKGMSSTVFYVFCLWYWSAR